MEAKNKKKSLLVFALLLTVVFNSQMMFATSTEIWAMQTNTGVKISMKDVKYLLTADNKKDFSVIDTKGNSINGISSISFIKTESTDVISTDKDESVINLFPNPVSSTLTVSGIKAGQKINVLSASGAKLINQTSTEGATTINVSSLAKGIYLLRIGNATTKFIKK
jgi:hypothetical protein